MEPEQLAWRAEALAQLRIVPLARPADDLARAGHHPGHRRAGEPDRHRTLRVPAAGRQLQRDHADLDPAAPDHVLDLVGGHRGLEGERSSSSYWVNRIISLAEKRGSLQHPVVLMHNQQVGNPATIRLLGQASPRPPQHHDMR